MIRARPSLFFSLLVAGLSLTSAHAATPDCRVASAGADYLENMPKLASLVPGFAIGLCSAEAGNSDLANPARDSELSTGAAVCGVYVTFKNQKTRQAFSRELVSEFGRGSMIEFPLGQNLARVRICGEIAKPQDAFPATSVRNN